MRGVRQAEGFANRTAAGGPRVLPSPARCEHRRVRVDEAQPRLTDRPGAAGSLGRRLRRPPQRSADGHPPTALRARSSKADPLCKLHESSIDTTGHRQSQRDRRSTLPRIRPVTNADLHCHSAISDGTLEPEAVAARAAANGVELWALTDHDEIGGQRRARDAALALGLPYLTGTEISVTFAGITVHIIGLGFDADDAALVSGLAATRGGRRERALEMAAGLARAPHRPRRSRGR